MRFCAVTRLKRYVVAAIMAAAASGCATGPPDEAYRLPPTTLEVREMETRTFEADEKMIIGACVALLQDMEYNIDRIEVPLGVITASKLSDAESPREKFSLFMVDLVCLMGGGECGAMSTASDEQQVVLTFVVQPRLANTDEFVARVTLRIDKAYQFPTDTTASILTSGLLGEQYVGLDGGGDDVMLKDGDRMKLTQSAMVLERMISRFLYGKAAEGPQSSNKK